MEAIEISREASDTKEQCKSNGSNGGCNEKQCAGRAFLKSKRARSGEAPDARTSLCTYCHAPPAPQTQAESNLSAIQGFGFHTQCRRLPTPHPAYGSWS